MAQEPRGIKWSWQVQNKPEKCLHRNAAQLWNSLARALCGLRDSKVIRWIHSTEITWGLSNTACWLWKSQSLCLGEHPEANLLCGALVLFASPGICSWLLAEIGDLVWPDVAGLAVFKLPPEIVHKGSVLWLCAFLVFIEGLSVQRRNVRSGFWVVCCVDQVSYEIRIILELS